MTRTGENTTGRIVTPTVYNAGDPHVIPANASGQPEVDVKASALPTGAATEATLGDVKTAVTTPALPTGAATEATLSTLSANLSTLLGRIPDVLHNIENRYNYSGNAAATGVTHNWQYQWINAGTLLVVTSISAFNGSGAATWVTFAVKAGGVTYYQVSSGALTQYQVAQARGPFYLKSGDHILWSWNGVTVGDTLYGYIHGYELKDA